MFVTVKVDVPEQVVLELGQTSLGFAIDLVDDPLEDVGQQILATEGELGGDPAEIPALDDLERMADECSQRLVDLGTVERFFQSVTGLQVLQQTINGFSRCAKSGHRSVVELKMAGEAAVAILVALFAEHDLVDEPTSQSAAGGDPWNRDAAKLPLQCRQQRHEVPDGEDVMLHKGAERLRTADPLIEAMFEQAGPQRGDRGLDLVNTQAVGPSKRMGTNERF